MRWKWDRIIGLYGAKASLGAGAKKTEGERETVRKSKNRPLCL